MNNTAKHIRALRQRALDDEWKAIDKERKRLERPIVAAMDAVFDEQRREALAQLDTMRSAMNVQERARMLSVDFLFDLAKWIRDTAVRLSPFIWEALASGYSVGGGQMGEDLPDLTSNDPDVRDTLQMIVGRTGKISQTTRDEIAKIVEAALRDGKGVDEVASEIETLFDDFKAYRPRTIAQTTVTGAFSSGQAASFRRIGYEKRWLSQRDGRVRETHFVADGQTVGPNDRFVVGRASLLFPGDPDTDRLEEIINCRCAMLPGEKVR